MQKNRLSLISRTVTELSEGTEVSKTYYAYIVDVDGTRTEITERCSSPSYGYGDGNNLRTERSYYPPSYNDESKYESRKIRSVSYPDGRLDTYTYAYSDDILTEETVTHGTVTHPDGIANKTTREIRYRDSSGNTTRQETLVYTGGDNYALIQWVDLTYDSHGRLTGTVRSDGTQTRTSWGCCGKESDTDARGITRSYTYDDLKRVVAATKEGVGTQSDIVTSYTYDAAGRRLTETVSAGGLSLTTSSQYDDVGRIISATDAAGLVTHYGHSQDGRVTTVTRPGDITEITSRYVDGRTKSITGTGVIPRYYTYGVNEDHTQWTQVNTGSPSSPMWEKTTVDALGRTIRVEKPGFSGVETTENSYNGKGQLVKAAVTGQADTVYAYDELGN